MALARTGRNSARLASASRFRSRSFGSRRSLVAKPPASPESLLDRFGPHPAYTPPGGWQDESRNPAERLVKTHCCFRSEERRVGKECRCGWVTDDDKEKDNENQRGEMSG